MGKCLTKIVKRAPHCLQICIPKYIRDKLYLPVGSSIVWSIPLTSKPTEVFFKTTSWITGLTIVKNGVGQSISVSIPPKVLSDLQLHQGDVLHISIHEGQYVKLKKLELEVK